MEPITDVIPFTVPALVVPDQQDALIEAMIEAAHRAKKTGWGADGDFNGVGDGEAILSHRFWVDPNFPIIFSEDRLESARRALVAGGQQTPIRVVKLPNPDALKRSHDGTTDQDLLIVDIDGALIFKAAARTSIDQFRARIEVYEGAYYKLLLRMFNTKAQQYTLRRVEKGRGYQRAKAAFEAEQAWRAQRKMQPLRHFPSYKEVAPQFGCASEADMFLCAAMAGFDEEMLALAESGKLTEDQLRELAAPMDADKRLLLAGQLAQRQEVTGKPTPREDLRNQIRLAADKPPKPKVQWENVSHPVIVTGFWTRSTKQEEVPASVALGCLMHDVAFCLDETEERLPKEAQGLVKKLRAILAEPAMQDLIAGVQVATGEAG